MKHKVLKSLRYLLPMMLMIIAASVSAQGPGRPGSKDREKWNHEIRQAKIEFISRELELKGQTKEQFQKLYEKMDKEITDLNEQTHTMSRNLRKKGKEATSLEYEKAAEAKFELKGRENVIEMKYYKEFKQTLTPEQLFRIKDLERKFNQKLMKEHSKAKQKK